jgi:hypothetical protein
MTVQSRISAAVVAALAFAVAGTTVVGHKIPDQHWGTRGAVLDVAFAIGLLAAALALPALADRLGLRRVGMIGTRLAQAGQVAMAIESIASTIHGGNTLGPVFALGLVAAVLGLVLLAIDGIRAGAARTLAPVPLVGLLVGIAAGDQGGAILLGVAWAAIAVSLSRRSVINPTVARA